jgi:hypothetical protein
MIENRARKRSFIALVIRQAAIRNENYLIFEKYVGPQ